MTIPAPAPRRRMRAQDAPLPAPHVPRWRTPDEAIREAVLRSPLRVRAISYEAPSGTREGAQAATHAVSQVRAVLGRLPQREQQILQAYACTSAGYRPIARAAGLSVTHTRRLHLQARDEVARRLVELGLIPERWLSL